MMLSRMVMVCGLIMVIAALWMLFTYPPGSNEFVVSLISLASGAVLVAIAITAARRSLRRTPYKEDK